jgi:hypothetical protein
MRHLEPCRRTVRREAELMGSLDLSIVDSSTTELWDGLVLVLSDYIAIPARSPRWRLGHQRPPGPCR